jgi:general stress protein CsbA
MAALTLGRILNHQWQMTLENDESALLTVVLLGASEDEEYCEAQHVIKYLLNQVTIGMM